MTTTRIQGAVGYASLWVADVWKAAIFFANVLGWSYTSADGPHRMVAGAQPPQGIVGLDALPAGVWDAWPRHNTLFLSHGVDDVAAAVRRIRDAGGQASDPADEGHGLSSMCTDDQDMPFAIHQTAEPLGASALTYLTFEVADSARAKAFFGAVFGWAFQPGSHADGWQIEGIEPMGGMAGGHQEPTVVPMYAVDDIESALGKVRAAGGVATEAEAKHFGLLASCADDQGTRFYLGQLS